MPAPGLTTLMSRHPLDDRHPTLSIHQVVVQLIQHLLESPVGLGVCGIERASPTLPVDAPSSSQHTPAPDAAGPVAIATGEGEGDDGARRNATGAEGRGPEGETAAETGDEGRGKGEKSGGVAAGSNGSGGGSSAPGSSEFAAAVAAAAAAAEAAADAASAVAAAASAEGGMALSSPRGGSQDGSKDPMDEDGDEEKEGGKDNTKGEGEKRDMGASDKDVRGNGVGGGGGGDGSCGARESGEKSTRSHEAMEWGITPSRITTLIKTLLRVSDEWGEEAKNFR